MTAEEITPAVAKWAYLPWGAGNRPTADVEAALDRIEQAMDRLSG